jgi:hypothetical protein
MIWNVKGKKGDWSLLGSETQSMSWRGEERGKKSGEYAWGGGFVGEEKPEAFFSTNNRESQWLIE